MKILLKTNIDGILYNLKRPVALENRYRIFIIKYKVTNEFVHPYCCFPSNLPNLITIDVWLLPIFSAMYFILFPSL